MTNTALPINASGGTPAYSAQQYRQATSALMANGSSRVLGALSGYRLGGQPAVLTVTSTVWTIGPFACIIDPAFTTTQSPYLVSADANNTGSVTAAPSNPNNRIDILYAQVNDTDIDSSGLRTVTVNYLAGTAGTSPVAPATPARSFLLATISVPFSGSPTIAVNNTFATANGGIRPVTSSTAYPSTHVEGQYVDDATLNALVRDDGTNWAVLTPKTLVSGPWKGTAWDGVRQQWHMAISAVTTPSAGTWTIALPGTFPNGIDTIVATIGDTVGRFIYLSVSLSSLSSIVGGLLDAAGTGVTTAARINLDIWGS